MQLEELSFPLKNDTQINQLQCRKGAISQREIIKKKTKYLALEGMGNSYYMKNIII